MLGPYAITLTLILPSAIPAVFMRGGHFSGSEHQD
jgi:hypothetical protein